MRGAKSVRGRGRGGRCRDRSPDPVQGGGDGGGRGDGDGGGARARHPALRTRLLRQGRRRGEDVASDGGLGVSYSRSHLDIDVTYYGEFGILSPP